MHMTADDVRSDRAIAKELKVSYETVRTARKGLKELQLSRNLTVKKQAKRKGRDGKMRRLPKKKTAVAQSKSNGRSPYSINGRDRLRGKAREIYTKAWTDHEFKQRATPNEWWEHRLTEALNAIILIENDREQHDKHRQFMMTPCTYNTVRHVIETLNSLISQVNPTNQTEQRNEESTIHRRQGILH